MKNNTSKFNLKIVTEADLKNTFKKMKKKKSAGTDGLSQENLINGGSTLASPLTLIIIHTCYSSVKCKSNFIDKLLRKYTSI